MPEQRGKQATADVKSEWTRAYQIYLKAPGDRYDKKKDRTARIDSVANELRLTRKQAKRRVRNYEAWQRNIKERLGRALSTLSRYSLERLPPSVSVKPGHGKSTEPQLVSP